MKQPQIGKLIRELRLETGLTQEQFAAHLGFTYSTINRWENGCGKPSPLATQKVEGILKQMGDRGKNLLQRYLLDQQGKAENICVTEMFFGKDKWWQPSVKVTL